MPVGVFVGVQPTVRVEAVQGAARAVASFGVRGDLTGLRPDACLEAGGHHQAVADLVALRNLEGPGLGGRGEAGGASECGESG